MSSTDFEWVDHSASPCWRVREFAIGTELEEQFGFSTEAGWSVSGGRCVPLGTTESLRLSLAGDHTRRYLLVRCSSNTRRLHAGIPGGRRFEVDVSQVSAVSGDRFGVFSVPTFRERGEIGVMSTLTDGRRASATMSLFESAHRS